MEKCRFSYAGFTVLPCRFKHRTIRGKGGLSAETEGGWETGIGLLNLRYWTNIKNIVLSLLKNTFS